MPSPRPTLAELVARVRGDFESRLSLTGKVLRRRMANVLAVVWSGAAHGMHGHIDWGIRQFFADTAEREFLLRKAAAWGVTPIPATYAAGEVTATGGEGEVIPAEEVLIRDDGVTYRVTDDAIVSGGSATVSVEAVEAGAAGNLDAGDTLAFESPIPVVDSLVTVAAGGIAGGFDQEGIEDTRARFLLRLRRPPTGGSDQDWEAWALSVAGVTRAWVYEHEDGLGTVTVRFMMDGEEDPFPDGAAVAAVQAKLDEERPTTDEPTAAAPVKAETAFTIAVEPDTTAVREAVQAELADLYFREAEPGDGDERGTILLSEIQTAIGVAEGLEDYTLTAPAADVIPALGEMPTVPSVEDITWA